jgi:hypothetical protein
VLATVAAVAANELPHESVLFRGKKESVMLDKRNSKREFETRPRRFDCPLLTGLKLGQSESLPAFPSDLVSNKQKGSVPRLPTFALRSAAPDRRLEAFA